MKLHIVVIRDIKANVYSTASVRCGTSADSSASFADECQGDPEKVPSQNIQRDFEVYARMVRRWRRVFRATETPKQIAVGSNYTR